MNDQPREVMSWEELGRGARELATAVRDDGFVPDLVLGIARGGLLVAGALGYALGVKNTFTMNVEFYTGVDERLDMPPVVSDLIEDPEPDAPYGVKGVGEPPTVVSTAAIVAALRDATGLELARVPVRPDDIAGLV